MSKSYAQGRKAKPKKTHESNGEQQSATVQSSLFNECSKHFGTDCLYAVLGVEKSGSLAEIKKGYYKMSLRYHPDKLTGDDAVKEDGKHKFQLIGKIYT
jgi:DnaJ-class molecular chaperone